MIILRHTQILTRYVILLFKIMSQSRFTFNPKTSVGEKAEHGMYKCNSCYDYTPASGKNDNILDNYLQNVKQNNKNCQLC